jgi:hypothetical protein
MGSDAHLPYRCLLTIRDRGKAVSYGEVDRDDGGRNHGFVRLKGIVDAASYVPEASDDPALAQAINALNHASTLFFTVGCEKALNQHDSQFWKKGYLEFAFNDAELCSDSRNYFALFQRFCRRLHRSQFSTPVMFEWEFEGAHFLDADVGGWTVCVWITTNLASTTQDAEQLWASGLEAVTTALKDETAPVATPIYRPT